QDAGNVNTIYLGTNLGVYRSLDRGASWAPVWTAATSKATKGKPAKKRVPVAPKANDTVRRAQQALNAAGYNVGQPDGRIGTLTTKAIRKFQADNHLAVTGKFDGATLAARRVPAGRGAWAGEDT